MKVSFTHYDPGMPRTIYYELFAQAVRRNPRFVEDVGEADLCLPAEDVALETNWPRYGNQASAFVRGGLDSSRYNAYLNQLVRQSRALCIVNMHPFLRLPQAFRNETNIYVADGSLAIWERLLNPRTISMPALPLAVGKGGMRRKSILASFRGVSSHPCRERLRQIHDGSDIICEFVPKTNHSGQVDAMAGKTDLRYAALMEASHFAFVPRGDALFSYRLLEAMSFGCIPIILSDGWILPFDRSAAWHAIGLHLPENEIHNAPKLLKAFPPDRIAEVQNNVLAAYGRYFADLDRIVESLLTELERLTFRGQEGVGQRGVEPPNSPPGVRREALRDYSRFDGFLSRLADDIYPIAPAEPHLSITRTAIESLYQAGLLKPGMRVLDIGCGQGLALERFRDLGVEALGIELGSDAQVCRDKGFDVREMDQNFMEFPEGSFDLVWCRHVLEHSVAPLFTLTEYRRLIKSGGYVYVEVPAPDTSAHHETNPNHYSVLPLSSWHHLFTRAGFVILRSDEIKFTVPCGPDVYWWFLLAPAK